MEKMRHTGVWPSGFLLPLPKELGQLINSPLCLVVLVENRGLKEGELLLPTHVLHVWPFTCLHGGHWGPEAAYLATPPFGLDRTICPASDVGLARR